MPVYENDRISAPSSVEPNRFLNGWRPATDGVRSVAPDGVPSILVATLERRDRSLSLELAAPDIGAENGRPTAWVGNAEIVGRVEANRVVFSLPGEELGLYEEVRVGGLGSSVVTSATITPARPKGRMDAGEGRLTLTGSIAASCSIWTRDRSRFGGRFHADEGGARLEVGGVRVRPARRGGGHFTSRMQEHPGPLRVLASHANEAGSASWGELHLDSQTGPNPVATVDARPVRLRPQPRLVLLYVLDALRADHAPPAVRDETKSATLSHLARSGTVFRLHRAHAPNTLPSTKALFTGRIWRSRGGSPLDDGASTLAESYREAGCSTALFSNNPYISEAYGVTQGFDFAGSNPGDLEARNDDSRRVHEMALEWLAAHHTSSCLFVYVHALQPHNPYTAPTSSGRESQSAASLRGTTRELLDIQRNRLGVSKREERLLADLYRENLAYADRELSAFLGRLDDMVPREESVIAVTSDHGEELFDHGGVLHGYTLFEEMLRIPLILAGGGVDRGRVVAAPTSTSGLHYMLESLAHCIGAAVPPCPREGLADLVVRGSPATHLASAASVKGPILSAQIDSRKIVLAPRVGRRWGQGLGRGRSRETLLAFDIDPSGTETVQRVELGAAEDGSLYETLLRWLLEAEAGPLGEPRVGKEQLEMLRSLGYAEPEGP